MMKNRVAIIFLMLWSSKVYFNGNETNLNKFFKNGNIRFVREFAISEDSQFGRFYFENPNSLAIDTDGEIYVCDGEANNIKKFNTEGKFIKNIGKTGSGPGELGLPDLLEVSRDRLAVWEWSNRRISIMTLEGEFIKGFRFSDQEGLPVKIRILSGGQIVIELEKTSFSDPKYPQECRIDLYSSDMEFLKTIYSRRYLRAKPIMKPRVSVPQPFGPCIQWAVSPEGKVVIGYSAEYKIEVFNPLDGKALSFSHEYMPVRVIDKDKEEHFSKFVVKEFNADGTTRIRKGAPDYILNNTEFPKFKSAFDSIIVDSEGNIWIHVYDKNRDNLYFDVFDKRGKYINHVKIHGIGRFPNGRSRLSGNSLWQIETDQNGLIRVVKYNISG